MSDWHKLDPANDATLPPVGELAMWGCVDLDDPTRWDYIDVGVRDGTEVMDGDEPLHVVAEYTHWCRVAPPNGGTEPTPARAAKAETDLHRLLSRIFRDGGHKAVELGERAVDAADELVAWLNSAVDGSDAIAGLTGRMMDAERRAFGLEWTLRVYAGMTSGELFADGGQRARMRLDALAAKPL